MTWMLICDMDAEVAQQEGGKHFFLYIDIYIVVQKLNKEEINTRDET